MPGFIIKYEIHSTHTVKEFFHQLAMQGSTQT